MNEKSRNFTAAEILGDTQSSNRHGFSSKNRNWYQTFGYCSVFAVAPVLLATPLTPMRSDSSKTETPNVGESGTKRGKLSVGRNNELLKRQSRFRLPHQRIKGFPMLATFSGADDCPGRLIPDGDYTAALPFVDSGDTTGANNTVSALGFNYYYYYYTTFDTPGPDHIYSFTLSRLGPNPQIKVSSSSGFNPLIYILNGSGGCPTGTNNVVFPMFTALAENGTATLSADTMRFLPLGTPIHLLIDSAAQTAGPYTIRMQDVTVTTIVQVPIDPVPPFVPADFVRQHYQDFLNRQPDVAGLNFWTNEITSCGSNVQCAETKYINVSAAFFLSIEFQETGYLVYRMHKSAFGNLPSGPIPVRFNEFRNDAQLIGSGVQVGIGNWEAQLETNKQAYALAFVQRADFLASYPTTLTAFEIVTRMNQLAGSVLSTTERNELIALLGANPADSLKRAQVLRAIAENAQLRRAEFNRAFVLMQYFGYLRRNPNESPDRDFGGYSFWLNKLDSFGGNFIAAEMVKAFISSIEYRRRFGL